MGRKKIDLTNCDLFKMKTGTHPQFVKCANQILKLKDFNLNKLCELYLKFLA